MDWEASEDGLRHVAVESDIEYIVRTDSLSGGTELIANWICRGCPNGFGGPDSRGTLFIRAVGSVESGKTQARRFNESRSDRRPSREP